MTANDERCSGKGKAVHLPVLRSDPAPEPGSAGVKGQPRVAKSKNARKRAIVLAAVQLLIIGHIALWALSRRYGWFGGLTTTPVEPSESMEFTKHGVINAGLIFFSLALLSTLIFGRWFCGWGCHVVMLQDLCGWGMKKIGIRPKPFRSRLLLWVPLLLALYMFIWPMVWRWGIVPIDARIGHELGADHLLVEGYRDIVGLFGLHLPHEHMPAWRASWHVTTTDFWSTFAGPLVAIPFLLVCGFGVVYFMGAKGFCTYGCPYGGFFVPVDQYSPARIRVTDDCGQCGHCTAVCTSNVRVHDEVREFGMVIDPGCMKTMDCVSVCPNDALYFGFGKPAVMKGEAKHAPLKRTFDLSKREEWALAGVFAFAFFSVRGVYDVVPMLFAVGIACCVTFMTWKGWRLISDQNVNLHRFRMKYHRKLRRSGVVFGTVTVLLLVLTAHSAAMRIGWRIAHHHDDQILILSQAAFTGTAKLTDADRASVAAARRWYGRVSSLSRGGFALLPTWQPHIDMRLAWLHVVEGDLIAAERVLRQAIEQHGESESLARNLAQVVDAQRDRVDEVATIYENAALREPTWNQLVGEYAVWAIDREQIERTIDVLEQRIAAPLDHYLHRRERDLSTLGWLATLEIEAARFDDALAHLEHSLEIEPKSPPAYGKIAAAHLLQGNAAAAIAALQRGIDRSPKSIDLNARMAQLLTELGRPNDAYPYRKRIEELSE